MNLVTIFLTFQSNSMAGLSVPDSLGQPLEVGTARVLELEISE